MVRFHAFCVRRGWLARLATNKFQSKANIGNVVVRASDLLLCHRTTGFYSKHKENEKMDMADKCYSLLEKSALP